jgi:CheY-like chemotaxis protein
MPRMDGMELLRRVHERPNPTRSDHADRSGHDRNGRRGDAERRLRLSDEALQH